TISRFPMDIIDRAVIGAIDDTLTPDIIDEIVARVRAEMDARHCGDARERNEQQIAAIDQQIKTLADAIASGGDMPALVQRLTVAHPSGAKNSCQRWRDQTPPPLLRA